MSALTSPISTSFATRNTESANSWSPDPVLDHLLFPFPLSSQKAFIPIRISEEERSLLRILEESLTISQYTDKVNVYTHGNSARIIADEIESLLSTILALAIAQDHRSVKRSLLTSPRLRDHAAFFQRVFEIGRRHKIRNPDKMRTSYGKMMFMLMDAQRTSHLGFSLVSPIKTISVYLSAPETYANLPDTFIGGKPNKKPEAAVAGKVPSQKVIDDFLADKLLFTAVSQVDTMLIKTAEQAAEVRTYRDGALEALCAKYDARGLHPSVIRMVVLSCLDCSSYLSQVVVPVHFIHSTLLQYFDPSAMPLSDDEEDDEEDKSEEEKKEGKSHGDDDVDGDGDGNGDVDGDGAGTAQGQQHKAISLARRHWLHLRQQTESFLTQSGSKMGKSKGLRSAKMALATLRRSVCLFPIDIRNGSNGARLTHPHETQVVFVSQTLQLWIIILSRMFQLWYSADLDLTSGASYQLADTGQGLNRVQSAPTVAQVMQACLTQAQNASEFQWIGSSVIHLGDAYVPNALVFIDKYCQIERMLTPIARAIRELIARHKSVHEPRLFAPFTVQDSPSLATSLIPLSLEDWTHAFNTLEYEKQIRKSEDNVVHALHTGGRAPKVYYTMRSIPLQYSVASFLLRDFFKHAFDGSGADDYGGAGSCIDGRLTSTWNWTSNIEKKSYYHPFLTTGFTGFDGSFTE